MKMCRMKYSYRRERWWASVSAGERQWAATSVGERWWASVSVSERWRCDAIASPWLCTVIRDFPVPLPWKTLTVIAFSLNDIVNNVTFFLFFHSYTSIYLYRKYVVCTLRLRTLSLLLSIYYLCLLAPLVTLVIRLFRFFPYSLYCIYYIVRS